MQITIPHTFYGDFTQFKTDLMTAHAEIQNVIIAGPNIIIVGDAVTTQKKSEITTTASNMLTLDHIKSVIANAISFGTQLMEQFAAENVIMGITQAGKTKEVSDYLVNVMRYIQTGSLYEVINEIDSLIAASIPASLSPFVTESRLNEFKSKIQTYLS